MAYKATATPGDMVCMYQGAGLGGQFRILSTAVSSAEAAAGAKRLRSMQGSDDPNAGLGVIESGGNVVFTIALFQDAATANTAAQLGKLVATVQRQLAK